MDLFFDNLKMGSDPAKGDVKLSRAAAMEILHFIQAVSARDPGVFDRMGNHPAQPGYWIANLQKALEDNIEEVYSNDDHD